MHAAARRGSPPHDDEPARSEGDAQAAKLIRGGRTKLVLVLGCVAVLGVGALVAPPRVPPPVARAEAAAPRLEAQVERRGPARAFRGVQDAGRGALRFSVSFPAAPRVDIVTYEDFAENVPRSALPSGFGLLVSAREVLTHLAATGGRTRLSAQTADGTLVQSRAVAYEPETGLLLLELAAGVPEAPPPVAPPAVAGELAVAAARDDGRDYVAPVFIAAAEPDRYLVTAASGLIFPGTPLFTLDGEPLAVTAGGAPEPLAYPVAASLERLRRLVAEGRGLPSSIGARLQALDGALAQRLGPGAALVCDLLPGGPAEAAGLRPGDVLLSVATAELQGVDDAIARLARLPAGVKASIVFARDGRPRAVEVEPFQVLSRASNGAPRVPPADAPTAAAVFADEVLRAAAVPGHAVVLAIEGRVVKGPQAAKVLLRRRPAPWLVYLQQGAQRFFALVGQGA